MSSNRETEPHLPRAGELSSRAPVSLGDALRGLPLVAPPVSAWPELAAQLAANPATHPAASAHRVPSPPRRATFRQRFALPAAFAAAVALALVATLPRHSPAPATEATTRTPATNPAPAASPVHNDANATNSTMTQDTGNETLATLQSRSHSLERWLSDTSAASAPRSAQDLAASAEIEDMIGMVDVQLSGADEDASLPLWRRRVGLLQDLAILRYGANLNQFKSGTATAANDSGGARNVVW